MPEVLRVPVADDVSLHVLHTSGPRRPYVLVHGLASNARLWDGVARELSARGHEVLAVDLRGHGRSDAPDAGYDTGTAADDLAALLAGLGLTGARRPVVAGQSWGGNVALTLAARTQLHALALLDGGWLRLQAAFPDWSECERALAPPVLTGTPVGRVEGYLRAAHPDWPEESVAATLANLEVLPDGTVRARLRREHHLAILRSMWEADPRDLYPHVTVPVLLMPAHGPGGPDGRGALVEEAAALLPDARVVAYEGADHDLHAQHPVRVARDLERLA